MLKSPHDLVFEAKQTTNEVSIDKAPAVIAQCDLLIDVREFEEFQAGHLPGAIHIWQAAGFHVDKPAATSFE